MLDIITPSGEMSNIFYALPRRNPGLPIKMKTAFTPPTPLPGFDTHRRSVTKPTYVLRLAPGKAQSVRFWSDLKFSNEGDWITLPDGAELRFNTVSR